MVGTKLFSDLGSLENDNTQTISGTNYDVVVSAKTKSYIDGESESGVGMFFVMMFIIPLAGIRVIFLFG